MATVCHAQFDENQLEKFSEEIQGIEDKFKKREKNLKKDVESLNDQISELKKQKASLENIVKRVEALEEKQGKLEELSGEERQKEIELIKVRYETGLLVIKDMIEFLKTLKSQFSGLDFQESYSSLANPNTYPSYKANTNYLKQKLLKKGFTLPDIDMGNILLNTVYSISRSLVSGQENKHDITKELVCVLDFTSKASADLRIVHYDLEFLTYELDKMIISFESLFEDYTRLVGYKRNFSLYIGDEHDNLDDELVPAYFKVLPSKDDAELEKELKSLKFGLKKTIDAYQEYEMFVRQGLAYYEKFESIVTRLEPNCSTTNISKEMQAQYQSMRNKLQKAKSDFEGAYKGKIKQTYIKQLSQG